MMEKLPPPPPEFCLFQIDHWSMCMTKAEWSGWAQAIGTVLAVLVAIWLAEKQVRDAVLRERSAKAERIAATSRLVAYLRDSLEALGEHVKNRHAEPVVARARWAVDDACHAVGRIDIAMLDNSAAVSALVEVRALATDKAGGVRTHSNFIGPKEVVELMRLAGRIDIQVRALEDEASRLASGSALARPATV